MKSLKFCLLISLIFSIFSIAYAVGTNDSIVMISAKKTSSGVNVAIDVKKGYGIQKKGLHQLTVYDSEEKILYEEKKVKFTGSTAAEDKDYFSRVDDLKINITAGKPARVKAKVFYCSFSDYFCSLEIVTGPVK